jgi:hypothetical protein
VDRPAAWIAADVIRFEDGKLDRTRTVPYITKCNENAQRGFEGFAIS